MMRVPLLPAAIGLILLAGCATEPLQPGAQPDETNISVTAFTLGTTISTIVVEVTGPDIGSPLIFNLSVDEATDVASGTVRVPHGDARIFALTAFDDAGEITHEGQAEIDVRPGQNPPLRINLGPRSGHVPVTVSFGSFSVIVVPSSASLDLGGASTAQLSVEVLDENGEVVSDLSNVQWATDAPAVATVDASGLVTGVMGGSATIVATYEGVAGMSAITVTGTGGLVDSDEDGWTSDVDCDDSDSTVFPGAPEIADGKDNDCDGTADNTLADGIAFVAGQSLWVLRSGGAIPIELPIPGSPRDPDYSPDGSRITFTVDGNIYVMGVGLTGLTQLTSGGMDVDPAWAPDASMIVFARADAFGIPVLHVMNADGSGIAPLVDGAQPDWSPDGSRIAFVGGFGDRYIHVMNADGTGAIRLTSTTASSEWDPAWSPDGARIAFRWGCDEGTDDNCGTSGLAEIYVVNADGTGLAQLTDDSGHDNLEPAWSPDGARIAYRHALSDMPGGGLLYIRNADGSGSGQQYGIDMGQREPAWSPTAVIP